MKIAILIVGLLGLTGCMAQIQLSKNTYPYAEKLCEANGGVKNLFVTTMTENLVIVCNNGLSTRLDYPPKDMK